MNSTLILEGIHFSGHCGLTQEERNHPQPIRVDLEIDCANSPAGETDNILHTIDYAQVMTRVTHIGTEKQFCLLESLGEHISRMLFDEFPILSLQIWVRKISPPLPAPVDSVGIRLNRVRNNQVIPSAPVSSTEPSSFLVEQHNQIPKGTILDVATGHGRNALYLANLGYSVVGLDRDTDALLSIQRKVQELNLPNVTVRTQDLEDGAPESLNLGTHVYDGIIVFFYLYRPLFPALLRALKPGGVLVYETFLIDNHRLNHHPRRSEFCLAHNELLQLIDGLRIVHYEEGAHKGRNLEGQVYTARLLARKDHFID